LGEALKEVDKAIEKEFQAFPNTLQSIRGIGPVYSAGIFSEIGDIARFPAKDVIAKMAGLTWKRYQSGNFEAEETHMGKRVTNISVTTLSRPPTR
jgi:transposase